MTGNSRLKPTHLQPHKNSANSTQQTYVKAEGQQITAPTQKEAVHYLNQPLCFVSSFVVA